MKAVWKGALPRLIAGTAIIAMGTATLVSGGATQAAAASKVTISVAYAANTTFDTTPLGLTWWTAVKKQYEKLYPNVTVNLIAVQGGEPDFLTKLALDYHTTSTSPTLAQFPSTEIALYQSIGLADVAESVLEGLIVVQAVPEGHSERGSDQRQDLRRQFGREQRRSVLRQGHPHQGGDRSAVAAEELGRHHQCRREDQEGRTEDHPAVGGRRNERRSQRCRLRHLEPVGRFEHADDPDVLGQDGGRAVPVSCRP